MQNTNGLNSVPCRNNTSEVNGNGLVYCLLDFWSEFKWSTDNIVIYLFTPPLSVGRLYISTKAEFFNQYGLMN